MRARRVIHPPAIVLVVDVGRDLAYYRIGAAIETPFLFASAMKAGRVLWAIPLADLSEARTREQKPN